jgi:hypothetical protein
MRAGLAFVAVAAIAARIALGGFSVVTSYARRSMRRRLQRLIAP